MEEWQKQLETGIDQYEAGEFEAAREAFGKVVAAVPEEPAGWFNLGLTLLSLEAWKHAANSFSEAIALEAGNAEFHYFRAQALRFADEAAGAQTDFDIAATLEPGNPLYFFTRANFKADQGNLEGALEDYGTALKIHPTFVEAWYNRGQIHLKRKDYYPGLRDIEKTADLVPENIRFRLELAAIRATTLDFQGALKDYAKAIAAEPNDPMPYYYRANTHLKLENFDSAVQDCTRCIEIAPDFGQAQLLRGIALHHAGKTAEACLDFKNAVQNGAPEAQEYFNRFCQ